MVPLKRHLLLLVLGALVPMLVLAIALTLLLVHENRNRTAQALHENARLLAGALDAELNRSIAALQTLSRNEALRRGDLRSFYGEAKDVRDSLGLWDNVLLLSPNGEHLFNLMRPFGTKLPPVPQPEGPVNATRTRQPYVSNALRGRVDTDWLMFMNYPVVVEGEVKYVLGVTMNYRYWSRWLTERVPQGFIASIIDRDRVILARTQDAERLAGQPVQPWFAQLLGSGVGGTARGEGVLDPDVVVAFHRSEVSGWHINLVTSGTVVDAPGRRTALLLAIGVAIALGLAIALALARAGVLTRGIHGLQQALEGLKAKPPHVPPLVSKVEEIDQAIDAARTTAQALRAQADAQRLLLLLNDRTRGLRNPEEVMYEVEALVGRHYGVARCTYGEIDAAEEHVSVARDYVDGVPSIAGRHRVRDFGPSIIDELKAGRTLALPDLEADPRTNGEEASAAFRAIHTRSLLCVPLVKEGRFVALFVLHHNAPRQWTPEETALIEQVAERTWLAVENARIEADLRESRDVLSLAMRGGRMGAWSRNVVTNEVWWSRELEEIFGLPPGGFEGSEDGFLAYVHPADREALMRAVSSAIEERRDYAAEFRFRDAAGTWRWMDGRGRAVYAPAGEPTMLYGVGIDITERKSSEDELRRLNAELSQADRRKDEFLATLAHELRNPLSPIRSAAEMLKRSDLPAEAGAKARDIIERQAMHMTRLVDDLLDLGRISHGELQLKKETVELASALYWAVDAARPALEEAGVALSVDVPTVPIRLQADLTRFVQIVVNLLNNAGKFTPRGGHAWLSARKDGEWIEIRVRDDGTGIDPAQLPRLFQMFAQATPAIARSQGGLGIGLALVRGLVERHGGTVSAHSAGAGTGTEFVVRLPVGDAVAQSVPPEDGPQKHRVARRVLLADDNRDATDSLAALLRLMGHEVRVAYDGEQALAVGAEFRPDAAILDIGMPRLNGYDVASRARQSDWGRGATLIALTGWGQQKDKALAAQAGFDHHLTKPVDAEAIDALLR